MSRRELKRLLEGRKDSNRNSFFINWEERQFSMVVLSETPSRKEVECPICLGKIRNTRLTICGHRFCKDCIEKSIRLGNHKCPFCRVHFPSRRSLKADKRFDKIISDHYPDIDDEKENLELNETERIRNETIKAATSQTLKRQCETNSSKLSTAVKTPRENETIIQRIPLREVREVPRRDGSSKTDPVEFRELTSSQACDSNKDKDKDPSFGDHHDHRVEAIPTRRSKIPIRRRKRARIVKLSQLPDTRINVVQANPLRTIKDIIQTRDSSEDEETDSSSGDDWCPLRRKKRDEGAESSQPPENQIMIMDSPLQRRTNVQTPALSIKDKGKAPCSASDGDRSIEVIHLSETESEDDSDENGSGGSKEESLGTKETPLVAPESLKWGRSGMRSGVRKRNVLRNRIKRLVGYLQNLKRTREEIDIQVLNCLYGRAKDAKVNLSLSLACLN